MKSQAWAPWQASQRQIVLARNGGKCEAYTVVGSGSFYGVCSKPSTDVHHNFGRAQEPWSSWAELCSGLCRDHHESVTGKVGSGLDTNLRLRLRADAVLRVCTVMIGHPCQFKDEDDAVQWWQGQIVNYRMYGLLPPAYDKFLEARKKRGNP